MRISQKISPQVIAAGVGLFQQFIPELTAQNLIAALKAYEAGGKACSPVMAERPLTRMETAELLQCSLNTVSRYLSCGKLKRIKLTERSCRIDAESVRALLAGDDSSAEV